MNGLARAASRFACAIALWFASSAAVAIVPVPAPAPSAAPPTSRTPAAPEVPGRIAIVRDARGPVKVRVTVPVTNGWKAIALSDGARQELFISTTMDRDTLEAALKKAAEDA